MTQKAAIRRRKQNASGFSHIHARKRPHYCKSTSATERKAK